MVSAGRSTSAMSVDYLNSYLHLAEVMPSDIQPEFTGLRQADQDTARRSPPPPLLHGGASGRGRQTSEAKLGRLR